MVSPVSWIHHWVYLLPALTTLAMRGLWRITVPAVWGAIAILVVGPGLADHFVSQGGIRNLLLGLPARECLLLSSRACVAVLSLRGNRLDDRRRSR